MDNLPMSPMTEVQRQSLYLADVAEENAEILTRSETALDPNTQANRERWNSAQVNNHESLFPFSDNLAISMFIVASDLTEAQGEAYKFLFFEGMNFSSDTFENSEDNISEIILHAEKLDGKSFTPRDQTRQQHEQNLYRRRLS